MSTGSAVSAGRVSRSLGWSTGGNLVLRVGNVLVSILVARLLAPDEYGVFAVALTVWTVLGTLAEFGLGSDLVRSPDPERRAPTVATLGLLTGVGFGALMAAGAEPVAGMFGAPEADSVVRLMAVSLVLFGFTIVPAAMMQREFQQGRIFAINLVGLLASAATTAALALDGYGALALAWAQVVNQAVVVVLQYAVTRRRLVLGLDRVVACESLAFCGPLALANLLSWVLLSVDNLIVAQISGTVALGLYVIAFNVSSWPMNAVGQAVRVVALPAFARHDATARARALEHLGGPVWSVALLLGLGLATLAEPVVRTLYGDRWRAAATALVGLALFGALRVVFDLLVTYLIAAGQSRRVLVVQVVWLVVMVPSMWWGVGRYGLAGAGAVHVVVAVVVVLPVYLWCLARTGVRVGAFLAGCVRPTVLAVPVGLGCSWLAAHLDRPWTAVLAGGLLLLAGYALPLAPWWRRKIDAVRRVSVAETEQTPTTPQEVTR